MLPAVLDLARSLVRIPSFTGEEGAVATFVAATMRRCALSDVHVDAWGNVIGLRHGRAAGPTLLFDGHMDVVELGSETWLHDPFGGEIADGRLWGRGACDTKGALAAMLSAAAGLTPAELAGTLVIAATVCEETVTGAALGHVLDAYPADVVITGEPTSLHLGVAQKGRATLRLHAKGRSAHTSQPQLGDNAAYKMIEAVGRLRALPLPSDPELGEAVLELVEIASQPLPNQTLVPDSCHARFVTRTMPGESASALLDRLANGLGGMSGMVMTLDRLRQPCYTGAVLETIDFLPGWRCPPDDPWRQALLSALATAGLPAGIYAAPCGTNASESAGRRGIPSFIFGPGALAQAHSADEWVAIDELLMAETGFAAIAQRILRVV